MVTANERKIIEYEYWAESLFYVGLITAREFDKIQARIERAKTKLR